MTVLSDPHTQAATRAMWGRDEWREAPDTPDGRPYYRDANGVIVYGRAPEVILGLDDQKAATLLTCMAVWFVETGGDLDRPKAARVHVDDLLALRGIRKHPRGGYQPKQREQAKADALFLRDIWVRSRERVWETTRRGARRQVDVVVDDPLVEVSVENAPDPGDRRGGRVPYALRFRPGPWARHYLADGTHWTTGVLRRVMGYHPYRDRLKMRLGIYLAFQWRIRAGNGTWDQPWRLRALLDGAKIDVPGRDPQRFFPRVLAALEALRTDGVLAVCEALDFPEWRPPADEPPRQWVPRLLEGRWRLLPAGELRERLPGPHEPGASA